MGVISSGDAFVAISYSGETKEVIDLVPRVRLLGVPVIAMTGKPESTLAELADAHLDVAVPSYEWPFGVLPTASNATTVGMGDALAVTLLVRRGVRAEDFASLHPGGLLGRKMLVSVESLMHTGNAMPVVGPSATLRDALVEMTAKRLGVTCIAEDNRLLGIITDGDLRRILTRFDDPLSVSVTEIMTPNPKTSLPHSLAASAIHEMESRQITSLPVVDPDGRLVGLVHMHDIVKLETSR